MSDLLLPRLIDNHDVPNQAASGEWGSVSASVLSDISAGMETGVDPDFFNVDSIPDVWARPLLFQMALYDDGHPLYKKTVGEWRGLAALIALKEWRGYSLTAQRVELHEPDGPGFSRIAARLMPSETIFENTRWSSLYCLLYDERPLGLTSPTTLLCTAPHYTAHGVPWFDGRRLHDPLNAPDPKNHSRRKNVLDAGERAAVAAWLDRLWQHLRDHPSSNEHLRGKLFSILRFFAEDLGAPEEHDVAQDTLGMSGQDAFQYLDEVPAAPPADPDASHVRLLPTRAETTGPPLLVLDPDIAEQWHTNPNEVKVWGNETLESIIPYGGLSGGWREIEDALQGAAPRRLIDFFTDKLYLLDNRNAFEHTLPVQGIGQMDVSPLLPVAEELLDYFDPQALADRIEFQASDGGGYRVRLRLPLAGPGGEGKDFTFEKHFERADVVRLDNLPVLEIWPNFRSPEWNDYYTFYDGAGAFYARPSSPPEAEPRTQRNRRNEVTQEITRTSAFPEAMLCYGRGAEGDAGDPFAGLLLLDPPEQRHAGGTGAWHVGVDFGTTNTTVYVREGQQEPHALTFPDRLRQITRPDSAVRQEKTALGFLPAFDQKTPFHTLYHTGNDGISPNNQPLLDGRIRYINQATYDPKEGQRAEEDVHSDLKWGTRQQDKLLTKQFLEQLCLQICAEAAYAGVSNIDWSYSVPTSFSDNQEDFVDNIWSNALTDGRATKQTESGSAAAFFQEEQGAAMMRGAVCIDIGGFSSDIAVWKERQMQMQSSLRLASRQIFLETIAALPGRFRQLFKKSPSINLKGLEIFLASRQGEQLMDTLDTAGEESEVRLLNKYIVLGVSGLIYYAGLLVRCLIERQEQQGTEEEWALPYLCIGGNGAKMLYWLHYGDYDASKSTNRLFEAVFREATGLDAGSFRLTVTPKEKMKHEVGTGLVMQPRLGEPDQDPVVLAGEPFAADGTTEAWSTPLTPERLEGGLRHGGDVPRLRKLIEIVNRHTDLASVSAVDFDNRAREDVTEAIDQYLNEMAQRDEQGDIDVEPLFIVGLRELLALCRKRDAA